MRDDSRAISVPTSRSAIGVYALWLAVLVASFGIGGHALGYLVDFESVGTAGNANLIGVAGNAGNDFGNAGNTAGNEEARLAGPFPASLGSDSLDGADIGIDGVRMLASGARRTVLTPTAVTVG